MDAASDVDESFRDAISSVDELFALIGELNRLVPAGPPSINQLNALLPLAVRTWLWRSKVHAIRELVSPLLAPARREALPMVSEWMAKRERDHIAPLLGETEQAKDKTDVIAAEQAQASAGPITAQGPRDFRRRSRRRRRSAH